jgi:hypothetical protein
VAEGEALFREDLQSRVQCVKDNVKVPVWPHQTISICNVFDFENVSINQLISFPYRLTKINWTPWSVSPTILAVADSKKLPSRSIGTISQLPRSRWRSTWTRAVSSSTAWWGGGTRKSRCLILKGVSLFL